jgi:hypothetical protein
MWQARPHRVACFEIVSGQAIQASLDAALLSTNLTAEPQRADSPGKIRTPRFVLPLAEHASGVPRLSGYSDWLCALG